MLNIALSHRGGSASCLGECNKFTWPKKHTEEGHTRDDVRRYREKTPP